MSIADKITQLTNIRAAIRTALQNKGISAASSHDFADFAADIAAIVIGGTIQSSKRVSASVSGPTYVTPDSGYDGLAQVIVNMITRQAKTVTPGTANQTVSPDSGYQGLSSVTVEGDADLVAGNIKSGVSIFGVQGSYSPSFQLQQKSVTPSASAQTVVADSGYDGLSQVNVAAAPLEAKTVTPTAAQQVVSPSSGKIGLSSVTVNAAPLETKSVTPSASQQTITPSSGKIGMSQVTVAGDADLIASNIKKDVQIFGVTGTYEGSGGTTNGSLIEVTCSSNIDQVTATVNGNTYTAYITGGKAYITIPYTDTTAARTCVLKGYASGTEVTAANLSMAAGVGYYTASLSTSATVYNAGTWTGVDSHTWTKISSSAYDWGMSETASYLQLYVEGQGRPTYAFGNGGVRLDPAISTRGYNKIEITVSQTNESYPLRFLADDSSSYHAGNIQSNGIVLSVGTNIFEIPAADQGKMLYLYFAGYAPADATSVYKITKIRFV